MAKIVFLGTGGWISSVERNEVSILLRVSKNCYLFDAGEATFKQLQKARINFKDIKVIFITHSHGDHILGIPSIILYQAISLKHKIKVFYPKKIESDIRNLLRYIPSKLIKNVKFCPFYVKEIEVKVYEDEHILVFCTRSRHTSFSVSYKVVLKRERRTIVYSGDTAPFENFIKFGRNVDVFIHEASLSNKYKALSFKVGHSTVNQAILVGLKCKAKKLILIHLGKQKIRKRKFKVKGISVLIPSDLEVMDVD